MMTHRTFVLASIGGIAALTFVFSAAPSVHAQEVEPQEAKCNQLLGKAGRKLASTITKANAKCLEGDISGKKPASCPDAKSAAKIDKAAAKLVSAAEKACKSACSFSTDITCIEDGLCPPLPNLQNPGANEQCSAGQNKFQMQNINFPGAFCEGVVGGRLVTPGDIGSCASLITQSASANIVTAIYGSLGSSALAGNTAAQKCLSGLSKNARKLSDTIYNGVISCTAALQKGKVEFGVADTCKDDDDKVAAKIAKAQAKLQDAADAGCTAGDIALLDLCLNGVGGTLTVQDAVDCLTDMAFEMTDTVVPPALRTYGPNALTEATYPPAGGVCGDAVVNQTPDPFLLLGEECDLTDDDACPGQCFPPGDLFECTCPGPRNRYFADGITSDLDSGFTGTSHNSGVADGAGFFYRLENCDCDEFTDATCTGNSSDSVCDITGLTAPSCSWDPFSLITGEDCDGNSSVPDKLNRDGDCHLCDQFSANAGVHCRGAGVAQDCQAQCYDQSDLDTPVGLCTTQVDCATGQICLGSCDRTPTCVITPNGSNLPISSGGTAVCVVTTFRENVTGTNEIVTGEHAWDEFQFSKVHLGVSAFQPCPLCGGFCDDGPVQLQGKPCEGTCSVNSSVRCRFDEDCPDAATGETCLEESADCGSGRCNLSLVCFGGLKSQSPCRLEAATAIFGTVSNDCPPDPPLNISGEGLEINFLPMTSGAVQLQNNGCFDGSLYTYNCDTNADCGTCDASSPQILRNEICTANADCGGGQCVFTICLPRPCEADGFTNYGCPCDDEKETQGNASQTRPNRCAMACDAGANFGQPCQRGTGGSVFGAPTRCSITQCFAEPNKGQVCASDADCGGLPGRCTNLGCDEDADCPGGSCSLQPLHCSGGDPEDEGAACTTSADCPTGTCGDACPGGRCVPLCLPSTSGLFSPRCSVSPFIDCTTNADCGAFGGTCEAFTDPDEAFCAGGPEFYRCSGFKDSFRICDETSATGSCDAVCADSCSSEGVATGGSGTACTQPAECPGSEICCGPCELSGGCEAGDDAILGTSDDFPGAGRCFADETNCFFDGGLATGVADATNPSSNTIYCTPPTGNSAINNVAGLGGPGRLRQDGVNVPMGYTQLP